jgi:oxygen-independent coproporphyrinogen-3 oxidase
MLQTPSLVPPELVEQILLTIKECLGVHPDAEITLEADPGTFNSERLRQYRRLGVNRISMGVQSFEEV